MGFLILLFLALLWLSALKDAMDAQRAKHQKEQDALRSKGNQDEFIVEEKPKDDFVVENVNKVCPPHKWRYQEVRDPEGNVIRFRIICDLCGPLKPQSGPARLG